MKKKNRTCFLDVNIIHEQGKFATSENQLRVEFMLILTVFHHPPAKLT